jgi:hypothetical protein
MMCPAFNEARRFLEKRAVRTPTANDTVEPPHDATAEERARPELNRHLGGTNLPLYPLSYERVPAILTYLSPFMRLRVPDGCYRNFVLWHGQNSPQAERESVHCADWIIGVYVLDRDGLAGGFFQHVCGNSEPVSAV